jgi:prepilin-type N-terminal cleavage/methylation domain-containing protein
MKRAGFSLIEVLVAMTLALVLLLGTAELVTLSIWARRKGDMTAGLTQALSSRLAALKSLAHAPGGLVPGDYSESVDDGAGRGRTMHQWTVEAAGERMMKVRLKVSPAGRPGAAVSVTVWISKDLGFAP